MLKKRIFTITVFFVLIICIWYVRGDFSFLRDQRPSNLQQLEYEGTALVEKSDLREGIRAETLQTGNDPSAGSLKVPEKGCHIHINLDELQLYVYKNGELLKKYPCSGGSPDTPSPLGTWRIISKDTWGEGFGGAWLGFNVPWGKYGIHGTLEPWFIGRSNSSQGCIRMKNKDVQELYKLVPHGTTVTIVHENPVFRIMRDGDVGSDVIEVQKALRKLGYYKGGIDGGYGPGLKQAVKLFQKDHKLYVTGVINRSTYSLIIEKYKAALSAEELTVELPDKNQSKRGDSSSLLYSKSL